MIHGAVEYRYQPAAAGQPRLHSRAHNPSVPWHGSGRRVLQGSGNARGSHQEQAIGRPSRRKLSSAIDSLITPDDRVGRAASPARRPPQVNAHTARATQRLRSRNRTLHKRRPGRRRITENFLTIVARVGGQAFVTFRNACARVFRRHAPFGAINQERGGRSAAGHGETPKACLAGAGTITQIWPPHWYMAGTQWPGTGWE
jgi:hypothetical protein